MVTSGPQAPIDICNLALDHLGTRAVSSIENPTIESEEILARHYDHVRKVYLREYIWNFAQTYIVLARDGAGSGGYADEYTLPNDSIRLNSIGTDRLNPTTDFILVQDRAIWVDNSGGALPIWYSSNYTDVGKMDPLFIEIVSLRLALNVAYKFTKKKSVTDRINSLLSLALPKAISVDGQESVPIRIEKSKFLTARRRGGLIGRNNKFYDFK